MIHLFNVWVRGNASITTILANSDTQARGIFIARHDLEIEENHKDLFSKQIY
jgi:hypothetical protein